mmetsp:Transcript_17341/g.42141  ORF Transcript_17341/g.42141 Transcript_17341/m.42141 type:complete len:135 (+) Transcript_17341:932-1336(+)
MKTAFVLSTLFVGAQSFAVSPMATQQRAVTSTTSLNAEIPEGEMSPQQMEIKDVQKKWNEIRHMDRDVAQKELEGEWLEAFNNFYEKYDEDMKDMQEIVTKLEKQIEPPRVQKKTKGQKRRDAYAGKIARGSVL